VALLYRDLTERVLGAAIEVHKSLGPGFLETIYETAFAVELNFLGIAYERQKAIEIRHRGQPVGKHRMDFVIRKCVVVEIKSADNFDAAHFAQVKSYLKATGCKVGLLLNFKKPVLAIKRFIL
jgi:GxxExxY protein